LTKEPKWHTLSFSAKRIFPSRTALKNFGEKKSFSKRLISWRSRPRDLLKCESNLPLFIFSSPKESFLRDLVLETIERFGARRCMFASNWHGGGSVSNSDGADECELSMVQLYQRFAKWVAHLGEVKNSHTLAFSSVTRPMFYPTSLCHSCHASTFCSQVFHAHFFFLTSVLSHTCHASMFCSHVFTHSASPVTGGARVALCRERQAVLSDSLRR